MGTRKHEFVIVGSGAGGATLARELALRGRDVLVVEAGRRESELGTPARAQGYYVTSGVARLPARSREGVGLLRTIMLGGTTVVSCGNAVPCLERELAALGVDVSAELNEASRDLRVCPIAEGLLSDGSIAIRSAAAGLGYDMRPMPKMIDPVACRKCAGCVLGCANGAKWTALEYVDEARHAGARILESTSIGRVLVTGGRAQGVAGRGPEGMVAIPADVVVLAAGGLGSPVILQRSGVAAGDRLFMDLYVNTYGVTGALNQAGEPSMPLVCTDLLASRGFILSPIANYSRLARFAELGARGLALPSRRLLGIMTKTADDPAGRVFADGAVSKPVTPADRRRLDEGSSISKQILIAAGADPRSIVVSRVGGAHPGATAAIGRVVGPDLQTKVDGLFVCDSSVLPVAPGLPPILTIVALAKRLAKTLAPDRPRAEPREAPAPAAERVPVEA